MDDCQESVLLHHYYHREAESYQDRSLLHHYQSLGYSFDAGVYCDRPHQLQLLGRGLPELELQGLDLPPELELQGLDLPPELELPAVARRILESPRKVKKWLPPAQC
jgi:hypothetical protein